jgi:hypothetical protein
VRARYTHPDFARRGAGRMILARCEAAAAAEGFRELELMATMAGRPLYAAAGSVDVEPANVDADGIPIPVVIMRKSIAPRTPTAKTGFRDFCCVEPPRLAVSPIAGSRPPLLSSRSPARVGPHESGGAIGIA